MGSSSDSSEDDGSSSEMEVNSSEFDPTTSEDESDNEAGPAFPLIPGDQYYTPNSPVIKEIIKQVRSSDIHSNNHIISSCL